jgi:hypothetical protein
VWWLHLCVLVGSATLSGSNKLRVLMSGDAQLLDALAGIKTAYLPTHVELTCPQTFFL